MREDGWSHAVAAPVPTRHRRTIPVGNPVHAVVPMERASVCYPTSQTTFSPTPGSGRRSARRSGSSERSQGADPGLHAGRPVHHRLALGDGQAGSLDQVAVQPAYGRPVQRPRLMLHGRVSSCSRQAGGRICQASGPGQGICRKKDSTASGQRSRTRWPTG